MANLEVGCMSLGKWHLGIFLHEGGSRRVYERQISLVSLIPHPSWALRCCLLKHQGYYSPSMATKVVCPIPRATMATLLSPVHTQAFHSEGSSGRGTRAFLIKLRLTIAPILARVNHWRATWQIAHSIKWSESLHTGTILVQWDSFGGYTRIKFETLRPLLAVLPSRGRTIQAVLGFLLGEASCPEMVRWNPEFSK